MRFSTLGYSIKQGVKNIWRNKMFSLASIATMGACIFLFGIFFAVVINFNYIVKNAETDVSMTFRKFQYPASMWRKHGMKALHFSEIFMHPKIPDCRKLTHSAL